MTKDEHGNQIFFISQTNVEAALSGVLFREAVAGDGAAFDGMSSVIYIDNSTEEMEADSIIYETKESAIDHTLEILRHKRDVLKGRAKSIADFIEAQS